MKGDRRAMVAATGSVLLALFVTGCGGDGGREARPTVVVGDARLATNGRVNEVDPGSAERRGGIVVGRPSLERLDRSDPPPAAVGSPERTCDGGALEPSRGNVEQMTRATVCLINAERTSRGLRALLRNEGLARAALAHARDMVRRAYFAHESRSGATFVDRIRRSGYMRSLGSWRVGENIAWGSGSGATAREIVDSWMSSPPHRANILQRGFREVGLGVAFGAPKAGDDSAAATYTTSFGSRSRSP
jgi:uncharacterized protein YkwD